MEQIVRIRETYDDGTALVAHLRRSACSGDCHKCAGCGAVEQTMLLRADNPIAAQVGDVVRVTSESAPVLRAAAVLYVLPVVLFFLGYFLGTVLAVGKGPLLGGLCFAGGICLAVFYDRRVASRRQTVYIIKELVGESLPKSVEKGDNEFD